MRDPVARSDFLQSHHRTPLDRIASARYRSTVDLDGYIVSAEEPLDAGVHLFDFVEHGDPRVVDFVDVAHDGHAFIVDDEARIRAEVEQPAFYRRCADMRRCGDIVLRGRRADVVDFPGPQRAVDEDVLHRSLPSVQIILNHFSGALAISTPSISAYTHSPGRTPAPGRRTATSRSPPPRFWLRCG